MSKPSINYQRDGALLSIRLGGDWSLQHELPAVTAISQQLEGAERLYVEGATIEAWDSGLISRLLQLHRHCQNAGVSIEANLPDGADRLLELALAVPLRKSPASAHGSAWMQALSPLRASEKVGAAIANFLAFIGALLTASFRTVTGRARFRVSDAFRFSYQTGPNALPIITLTGLLVGMILGYLGAVQLQQFGAGIYVANLVTVGILREMGSLMTAIIIAGRTGAAYAAQLGTMRVNEEVDAIEILGISTMEFLVLPRIIAVIIMVPLLSLYADVIGIVGGGVVASGLGISPLQYWSQVEVSLDLTHLTVGLVKATFFGALIGIAGCRAGLNAGRDSEGVGKATTSAVVVALIYLIVADAAVNLFCQLLEI